MRKITIGRNDQNDIVLAYPQISGNHAEIIINDDGSMTLVDFSSNGTYINGRKCHHNSFPIRRGDNVSFANQASLDWNRVFASGTQMMGGSPYGRTAQMGNGTARQGNPYANPQQSYNQPYNQPYNQQPYQQYGGEDGKTLVMVGWFLLFTTCGIGGLICGLILYCSKVNSQYKYDQSSRKHGLIQTIVASVLFLICLIGIIIEISSSSSSNYYPYYIIY